MNQINDISRITRKFLSNHICFASLGAGKRFGIDEKILTKIASGLIAFETACASVAGIGLLLLLEGARISLRFLGLRYKEIIEFGGKNSLRSGDDSKRWIYFLIIQLINSKFGLYVGTKGKIFLEFLTLGLSSLFLGIAAA